MTSHSEHIVSSFDEDLGALALLITEMGGLAERMVEDSVTALIAADSVQANAVIENDQALDDLETRVEQEAVLLIAKRQPMAQDLRAVIAAFRISSDLERIGDLAKNIARRTLVLEASPRPRKPFQGVAHMTRLVMNQLKDVLDSYTSEDEKKALRVRNNDAEIDQLYGSLFRELLTYMMEDPRNIGDCTHLMFCAKNLERIGDHATNIAETVHYRKTGYRLDDDRPKLADARSE